MCSVETQVHRRLHPSRFVAPLGTTKGRCYCSDAGGGVSGREKLVFLVPVYILEESFYNKLETPQPYWTYSIFEFFMKNK